MENKLKNLFKYKLDFLHQIKSWRENFLIWWKKKLRTSWKANPMEIRWEMNLKNWQVANMMADEVDHALERLKSELENIMLMINKHYEQQNGRGRGIKTRLLTVTKNPACSLTAASGSDGGRDSTLSSESSSRGNCHWGSNARTESWSMFHIANSNLPSCWCLEKGKKNILQVSCIPALPSLIIQGRNVSSSLLKDLRWLV